MIVPGINIDKYCSPVAKLTPMLEQTVAATRRPFERMPFMTPSNSAEINPIFSINPPSAKAIIMRETEPIMDCSPPLLIILAAASLSVSKLVPFCRAVINACRLLSGTNIAVKIPEEIIPAARTGMTDTRLIASKTTKSGKEGPTVSRLRHL